MVTAAAAESPLPDFGGGSNLANFRRGLELRRSALDCEPAQTAKPAQSDIRALTALTFSPQEESLLAVRISEALLSERDAREAEADSLEARLSGQLMQLRGQLTSLEILRVQPTSCPTGAADAGSDESSALRDLLAEHMADHDSQLAELRCRLLQAEDAQAATTDHFERLEVEQETGKAVLTETLAEFMSAQDGRYDGLVRQLAERPARDVTVRASGDDELLCERLEQKMAQCIEEHRVALAAFADAVETRLFEGSGIVGLSVAEEYESQAQHPAPAGPAWLSGPPPAEAGPDWLSGPPVEALLPRGTSALPPPRRLSPQVELPLRSAYLRNAVVSPFSPRQGLLRPAEVS